MRQMRCLLLLSILFFISACSPRMSATWIKSDYTSKKYDKIAVILTSQNLAAKNDFEKSAVALLQKKGINGVIGSDIFASNMPEKDQTAENFIRIIKENQLDGVITMSLIDIEESTKYEMGTSYTIGAGYYKIGKYLVRRYQTIRTPGYYVATKSYLIEAVFHDLQGDLFEGKETIIWRGQSALQDPASIRGAAKSFTNKMVNQMLEEGVVKP